MPRDADSQFDQVLARHLRRGAAEPACPDVETLAAYHERALSTAEMDAFKEHFASCGHCQQVLAALELSDPAHAIDEEHELVAAAAASAAKSAVRGGEEVIARMKPRQLWRWVAPAAAIAAGILVWVMVRGPRQTIVPPTEVAMNKTPNAESEMTANVGSVKPPAPAASLPTLSKTQARQQPEGPRKIQEETRADARLKKMAPSQGLDAARGSTGAVTLTAPKMAARERTAAAAPAPPMLERQAVAGTIRDWKDLQATARPENNAPAAERVTVIGGTPAVEGLNAEAKIEPMKQKPAVDVADNIVSTAAPVSTETMAQVTGDRAEKKEAAQDAGKPAAATMRMRVLEDDESDLKKVFTESFIAAPGGSVLWRVGAGGRIEKSVDVGKTWSVQPSGVTTGLIAGSAPSERDCWVVGREGTVLRTTDGEHWTKLPFPAHVDLMGVTATSQLHAVVWSAGQTKRFETNDGGAAWKVIAGSQ